MIGIQEFPVAFAFNTEAFTLQTDFFSYTFIMGRSSYTVEFKLKAVRRLKSEFSGNLSKASRALNISRKQLREWNRNEVKMANLSNKQSRRYAGAGRGAKYPLLEEQLLAWFKDQRESKLVLYLTFSFL